MNNENPKQQLIDEYIKKVNNTPDIELNQDQKELIKEILTKIDPKYIQNAYQMLNQRVKIGFTFDEAPSTSKTNIALLVKDEKRSFTNNVMNASDFENSLIIGENYDALKNLIQIEKIRAMTGGGHSDYDIIYIDPPYNTESAKTDGNVSANNNENISASKFIYRDKFSRNGWLNMMKERLIMARQLLKEDGVIFVSIDDNEQAYLKVLMDEIFGEENFVSNLIWIKKKGPGGNTSFDYKIVKNTEYIICYAKKITNLSFNYKVHDSDELKRLGYVNKDEYFSKRGYYKRTFLFHPSSTGSFQYIKSLDYPIIAPNGTEFMLHVNKYKPESGCYTWGYDTYLEGNKLGFIECIKNENNEWVAYRKQYQYVKFDPKSKKVVKVNAGSEFTNLIDNIFNQEGGAEIKLIYNNKNAFDFPKPTKLIQYLINFYPNKNARVLDFFAGSGTTGHAVLELNREDGGSRTYTLVTNNENNIGSNVTYERLYRINNGKGTKGETDFKWLEKNDSYNQNLNVYNIEYFDASIDKREKDESDDVSLKLLKKLDELLNSLNLKSTKINNEQKLNILTELNALDKEEIINESK